MNKKRKKKVILKEIWKHFRKRQVIYLATMDSKTPRVRPVVMIHHDRKLWVLTGATNAKVYQIKQNPNFEFCLLLKGNKHSGSIRGSGKAIIIRSMSVKKELSESIEFFKEYWNSYKDPDFCLLRLKLRQIEYVAPKMMSAVMLHVK